MLLGDLLKRFADPAVAAEAILASGDLALLTRMREAAAASGLEIGEFAAAAVRNYAAAASDEEWLTLMGTLARAPDPGTAYLRRAFAHATAAVS